MLNKIPEIFLFVVVFTLFCLSAAQAASDQRVALVIGNSAYSSGPLRNPVNDATEMSRILKKIGFSVTVKKNAGLQEMDEAIEAFGHRLKRGGVGLFYYAGHGVQVNGINYMVPIGARINKESDVKYQAVDINRILDEMANANNGLNIIMLDACRDNPYARSFRSASRGLAIVSNAPSGTFISYSTSPGSVARDGDGQNSPYTSALIEYLQLPGLSISDVFIKVRAKVKKETGQVPWELSSLEGQFYFLPGVSRESGLPVPSGKEAVGQKPASAVAPVPEGGVSYPDGKKQSKSFQIVKLAGGDRYEGEIANGTRNGKGNYYYANGNHYEGEFLNDRIHGRGVFVFTDGNRYEGEFRDGKRNGKGTYYYANGNRYEGEFFNDKLHGRGIFIFTDGGRYEGEFRVDKRNGKGTYYYANGNRYEGEFLNDKIHGWGIFVFMNGERYAGEFRDEKRSGQGTYTFPDGRVLRGLWKEDVFQN